MTKCEAAIKLVEMVCDLRVYAGAETSEYREAVAIACAELYKGDEEHAYLYYINEVNHQLLNDGKISMEQFQAAARELAKEIIKR